VAIVTEFYCLVQDYVARFAQLVFPRPAGCPLCGAVDTLIGHGFYLRQPIATPHQVYSVYIKRWYCKACHHTVSMLPSFLLRYRHYLLDVIQPVVVTRFEDNASWTKVSRRCAVEGLPSSRTIRRWCVSFASQAPAWWSAVQEHLALQDASSPLLDPLGETAGPRDAPRALLHATLHLLAWAKTCLTDVSDYSRNDRLRFLWHWGSSQGLGRLI
jgi:hypothetical protein